jgi:hypothetical protein
MKLSRPSIGLVSSAFLLGLIPAAQALPQWLQPHIRGTDADPFAPRDYTIYERAEANIEHYTHYGYGPQPTISTLSSGSVASTDSGEETSSSGTEFSQSSTLFQSSVNVNPLQVLLRSLRLYPLPRLLSLLVLLPSASPLLQDLVERHPSSLILQSPFLSRLQKNLQHLPPSMILEPPQFQRLSLRRLEVAHLLRRILLPPVIVVARSPHLNLYLSLLEHHHPKRLRQLLLLSNATTTIVCVNSFDHPRSLVLSVLHTLLARILLPRVFLLMYPSVMIHHLEYLLHVRVSIQMQLPLQLRLPATVVCLRLRAAHQAYRRQVAVKHLHSQTSHPRILRQLILYQRPRAPHYLSARTLPLLERHHHQTPVEAKLVVVRQL